jgi:hypothetical protein
MTRKKNYGCPEWCSLGRHFHASSAQGREFYAYDRWDHGTPHVSESLSDTENQWAVRQCVEDATGRTSVDIVGLDSEGRWNFTPADALARADDLFRDACALVHAARVAEGMQARADQEESCKK